MYGPDVKLKVIANNNIIEQEAKKGLFILSKAVQEAIAENERLRNICEHQFDDLGYCIYCDKKVD